MKSPLDILLLVSVSLAAFFDMRERRIPNWITFSGSAIALVLHAFTGSAQLLQSLAGLTVGAGVMIAPFACGWMGAGDVKLFGLIGAVVGLQYLPRVFFYSTLAGGVLGAAVLVSRGTSLTVLRVWWLNIKIAVCTLGFVTPVPISEPKVDKAAMPLGLAIAAGTLIAVYVDRNGRWAGF